MVTRQKSTTTKADPPPAKKPAITKAKPVSIQARAAKLKKEISQLLQEWHVAIDTGDDAEIVRCKNGLREKRAELSEIWDAHSKDGKLSG